MKYLFFYIALHLCLLASCSSSEDMLIPELSVEKEIVDFSNKATSQSIMLVTNGGVPDTKSDKSWCHPSATENMLKIAVDESDERLIREATVTVTSNKLTKTVKVRQLGYEAAILIDQQSFYINAIGGDLSFNVTTNVKVKATFPAWIKEKVKTRAGTMTTTSFSYTVNATTMDDSQSGTIVFSELLTEGAAQSEKPVEAIVAVTQRGLNEYVGGDGEDIKGDIKLTVTSGTASSYHEGEGLDKSFDGNYSTIYHSDWNNGSSNYFPITLTYNLDQPSDADYLIYYPRTDGQNGRFKEVKIEYSEDGNSFKTLIERKDFLGAATATKILFNEQVRAKSFRFIVNSGAGDGQGFASCAEMEFYAKNPSSFDYKTLFTDETCSELKPGVTEEIINSCEFPFFKNLAYFMFKDKYNREFRIDEYKAYPSPDLQSATHKTNQYSLLDNPTGISVKENETLIVMVGDMHGQSIGLKVQNLDAPGNDGFGGLTYPLSEGINKLTMRQKGLVYVMYHTNTLDDTSAKPIKIHFASGTVNGYYDTQKHSGRWSELLSKATDRYFDVVGKYAHLTFETNDFRKYATTKDDLIKLYDDIAYNEQLLLGLAKYNSMFKNRMYLNVMYHSYMYATSYHTGYNQTTMSEICNPAQLQTGACWGPAHEIGHCNQVRPGVLWIGMTEVSNNIMSEYIQTTIFNQPSRIQDEDMGHVYRNRYSKAWTGIIANEKPHADFQNVGGDANDVFCKLVPCWQLELYFGKVLGKTPLQQPDKGGFYPDVYEYARQKNYNGMSDGETQLDFVYNCCLASKKNLLDFFEKWGFLREIDKDIEDYATRRLKVTSEMANALRNKINALGYPKPAVALEYISDNTIDLYKSNAEIVKGANATHTPKNFTEGGIAYEGESISISNWRNAVTYEVKNASGKLVFICSGENSPSSTAMFTMPERWKTGFKLYAVSAAGTRVEIPMN